MNKNEMIEVLASKTGLSKAKAGDALDATLGIIQGALIKGDKVQFVGFGTFEVGKREARIGRNPQTGAEIKIAAANVPKFKAGATLKAAVNTAGKPKKK